MKNRFSEDLKALIAQVLISNNTASELESNAELFLLGPLPETRNWNTKRTYVLARLENHSIQDLVATARRILEIYPTTHQRQEIVSLLPKRIKPDSRTKLLDEITHIQKSNKLPISGNISAEDLAKRVGKEMSLNSFATQIFQLDYNPNNLVENFHLTEELDEVFFRFLEAVTHPLACINTQHQTRLVSAINKHLAQDSLKLIEVEKIEELSVCRVQSVFSSNAPVRKIIFAASDDKPNLVVTDVLSGELEAINPPKESYLIYADEIPDSGLTWGHLIDWWVKHLAPQGNSGRKEETLAREIYTYLHKRLQSTPEKNFFHAYCKLFPITKKHLPALIPQFYLRWDPYTGKQVRLHGQRYDFLQLLPTQTRVLLEVDGIQHYALSPQGEQKYWRADPEAYTKTMKDTRDLLLSKYLAYRFSTQELLSTEAAIKCLSYFFNRLFSNHGIL
ncbi:hypothetical protein [Archangium sp.]|uniref:AbiJ-related protein n=1 Tax=Archangium sp. TaxID=1872627 RepID=UPI002D5E2979|nr:hypothetical protein [Archangium sp.]HYO51755.1 hypothetical protein [Archangium sp.]